VARVTKAFDGASPLVLEQDRGQSPHPRYLRFQWATQYGNEQLAAAMAASHPKSHFIIVERLISLDDTDRRGSNALWVKGKDGKAKLILPVGAKGHKYKAIIARLTHNGKVRDVTLQLAPGSTWIYLMDDAPFETLVLHGDAPAQATRIYELKSSPRLDDRARFFAAY